MATTTTTTTTARTPTTPTAARAAEAATEAAAVAAASSSSNATATAIPYTTVQDVEMLANMAGNSFCASHYVPFACALFSTIGRFLINPNESRQQET